MKRSKWTVLLALLAALSLVAAACGGDDDEGGTGGDEEAVEKIPVTVYFPGALARPVQLPGHPGLPAAAQLRFASSTRIPRSRPRSPSRRATRQVRLDDAPPRWSKKSPVIPKRFRRSIGPGFSGESTRMRRHVQRLRDARSSLRRPPVWRWPKRTSEDCRIDYADRQRPGPGRARRPVCSPRSCSQQPNCSWPTTRV